MPNFFVRPESGVSQQKTNSAWLHLEWSNFPPSATCRDCGWPKCRQKKEQRSRRQNFEYSTDSNETNMVNLALVESPQVLHEMGKENHLQY